MGEPLLVVETLLIRIYLPQILIKKGIDALYVLLRINVEGLSVLRAWDYPELPGIARAVV